MPNQHHAALDARRWPGIHGVCGSTPRRSIRQAGETARGLAGIPATSRRPGAGYPGGVRSEVFRPAIRSGAGYPGGVRSEVFRPAIRKLQNVAEMLTSSAFTQCHQPAGRSSMSPGATVTSSTVARAKSG